MWLYGMTVLLDMNSVLDLIYAMVILTVLVVFVPLIALCWVLSVL
jgi:hypothetical protein